MKKIMTKIWVTLAFLCFALPFVKAQNYDWNFSDAIWSSYINPNYFTDNTNKDNLTFFAGTSSGSPIENFYITAKTNTLNSVTYNDYLQFNGGGSPSTGTYMPKQRYLSFNVDGPVKVDIVGQTGSSSANRNIYLTDGNELLGTFSFTAAKYPISEETVSYTESAATILYLYCDAACNVYEITVTPISSSSSTDISLQSLTVDGTNILETGKKDYTFNLPEGTVGFPTVAATATDPTNVEVAVTQADDLSKKATIVVTDKGDATNTATYTVTFNVPVPCTPVNPATGKDWNFSNTSVFGTAPVSVTNGSSLTIDCITIVGSTGTSSASSIASHSSGGYTQGVNLGGATSGYPSNGRYISFDVGGPATITVYYLPSSPAVSTLVATDNASYNESHISDGNNALQSAKFSYTGLGGNIHLYVTGQNAYFYEIIVSPPLSGDASLSSLKVGTTTVTLVGGQTNYTVDLPGTTETVPTTTATATDGLATVDIHNALNLAGQTTIDVTAQNGTTVQYKVSFSVDPLITSFKAAGVDATIDNTAGTIKAELPVGESLTSINPEVTMNAGGDHYAPTGAQSFTTDKTYTVYNAAETKSKAYTVTLKVAVSLSSDATLSGIKFNDVAIDGFDPATNSYEIELPYGSDVPTADDVTATTTHPNAVIGTIVASGTEFPVNITIPVTAQDGTPATYILHFKEKAPGVDVTLATLTVSGTDVLEAGKTDYAVELPFGTTAIPPVTATATDENANVVITDATALPGTTTVDVTAEDGVTKQQYKVTFNPLPPLTWDFSKFAAGDITAGVFDCLTVKGVASGTAVSIDANTKSMDGYSFTQRLKLGGGGNPATGTYLPTVRYVSFPVAGNAKITIYGMSSGSSSATLEVTDGVNLIDAFTDPSAASNNTIKKGVINYTGPATTIYLYSLSGGFNIYGILVDGALGDCTVPTLSGDATLKSLAVNGTAVTLEAGKIAYTFDLPIGTTDVPAVTATATNDYATVKITDAADLTGKTTIDVTAEDGVTKLQYTVSFNVLLPDPLITAFKVAGVSATIDDEAGTIKAELSVGESLTAITPEVEMNAGGDHYAPTGAQSFTTDKTYTVYNTDETKSKAYTVTLKVAVSLSDDATLSYIKFKGATIDGFAAGTSEYNIELPYGSDVPVAADVTADVTHLATIGTITASDTKFPVDITIPVTAQDGTSANYILHFTMKAPATDATLKTLTVDGNSVTLVGDQKDYTVDLPNGTVDIPMVAAAATDPNAKVVVTQATDLSGQAIVDVTAEDGVTKLQYTVSFNVLLPGAVTTWNFTSFALGDITEGTFDCLTVKGAAAGTEVSIDANNKSIDGYSFTQRLKLGGGGNPATETPYLPTQRYLSFPVAGNAIITIYGMSSATTNNPRTLEITNGTTEINTFVDSNGSSILKKTITYTGPATTIYLYAAANGFNIYAILVEGALGNCTPALSSDATLKSLTVNGTAVTLSAGKTAYTVDLPVGTTAVPTIIATANDPKATVKVTDAAKLTGQTTIDVTAEDGTTLQYKVSFNVLLPDPLITAFKAAGVSATIDDEAGTIKAELPVGTVLTAIEPKVTMNTIGDHYAPTGAQNFTNPVTYTVSNADDSKNKAYIVTLTVAKLLSTDATLKTLMVNGTDVLEAGKTAYTVDLPYGTTAIPKVTATANDENATVLITDAADLTGAITIDVTAEDGVTKLQYTVSFNILPPPPALTWNFSEYPFEIGNIEGTVNGLTITGATSGAVVMIDNDNQSIDGYSFTQRLILGGNGSPATETPNLPTQRYLSFDLAGDAAITIFGMSDNDTEGTLVVTDGKNVIGTFTNDGISIDKAIINYTGSATTLYIYSLSGGFNIYAILVDGDIMLSIKNLTSGKEVKFVSYYDLLGRPVPANTTGLIIVKTTYKDGSSTNIKVYRQQKYVR